MDNRVEKALNAGIDQFSSVEKIDASVFKTELLAAFDLQVNFLDKTTSFDAVFDSHTKFDELREVFFDLLMINFFSNDVKKLEEDYLEGQEWGKIEEETIDRGTELLNLLLYIKDCHDEDLDPELDDFLKEFLLVEDDEFQDEFEIYEDLIDNQDLANSDIKEICEVAGKLDLVPEMEELFVPFLAFFSNVEGTDNAVDELAKYSSNAAFETAVYSVLITINN